MYFPSLFRHEVVDPWDFERTHFSVVRDTVWASHSSTNKPVVGTLDDSYGVLARSSASNLRRHHAPPLSDDERMQLRIQLRMRLSERRFVQLWWFLQLNRIIEAVIAHRPLRNGPLFTDCPSRGGPPPQHAATFGNYGYTLSDT